MDNGSYTRIDELSTRIDYEDLHKLERIRDAAKEMAKAIITYDKKNKTHIQDGLSAKTRKCLKKDL